MNSDLTAWIILFLGYRYHVVLEFSKGVYDFIIAKDKSGAGYPQLLQRRENPFEVADPGHSRIENVIHLRQ